VPNSSSVDQLVRELRDIEWKACGRERFAKLFKKYEEENEPQSTLNF